jgi:hypothetical protein
MGVYQIRHKHCRPKLLAAIYADCERVCEPVKVSFQFNLIFRRALIPQAPIQLKSTTPPSTPVLSGQVVAEGVRCQPVVTLSNTSPDHGGRGLTFSVA